MRGKTKCQITVVQYTSRIEMVYGRDYLAPDWIYGDHPIREVMNQEKYVHASYVLL